ncbi:MAG TPA: hypothetical protein VN692_11280 [Steroidobacteraceae bacterium]|nr:hypothetical protein [Steroidobacteraceae bacterium]
MSTRSAIDSFSHPEFRGRIGLARSIITPPDGIYARLWGSATHDIAEGVHRPFFATALSLQSDSTPESVVLITLDAIALWQEDADRIRDAILKRFDMRPEQLMLHPSHTHSSPALARRHAERPGGHLIAPYLDSLPQMCCELVAAARTNSFAGLVGWSYGKCGLAFNRDSHDEPTGRGICGINRSRTADDTVLVGRISDTNNQIRGVMVNYACHPVSMGGANKLLSPDYVGPMRDVVERETGAICLFLHGASGDLTPRRSYESLPDAAEQNGRELGFAALAALGGMLPPGRRLEYQRIEESGTPLGIWVSTAKSAVSPVLKAECVQVKLPLKDYPPRDTILARIGAAKERYEVERLERMLAIRSRLGDQTVGTFPVTVWRVGDAYMVSTTGEPYSRYQIALREQFADSTVAVLNLTNGATNYLPEAAAYEQDNYPARVTEYAAGCLEHVITETFSAMHSL